jgi:acyl-CoA synthetase (AMP-forming)/AMP-acid ligase II
MLLPGNSDSMGKLQRTLQFPHGITTSQTASIVYTSGSTASAKGVVLSHGNFCFIARSVADCLGLNETDRCALILPLCHTYGKSVLLSAAAAGAAVVLLDCFGNHQKFLSLLNEEGCTVLSAVPYHLHTLVKSGCLSLYGFSSLRLITSSADKLSPSVLDSLMEALPNVRIFSMYGLTEAATRVCCLPPEFIHIKKKSCGRPLPCVELNIALEDGRAAPVGETGEILLRGPNVMSGYWNDPDLTAATIVNGWLKTGDLGHMDADGFLYIDGRKKDLIKCAGESVCPLEIEEIIMEHPGVEEAAVIGRPDSLMGEIIHAYVTSRDSSLKKSDLREHCRARLPHNKVPYTYTIVERLPRTNTGKDQKHLLKG